MNTMYWKIVEACIAAGHYPKVMRSSSMTTYVVPHRSSIFDNPEKQAQLDRYWLIFWEKSQNTKYTLLRHVSIVSPINIILFSGSECVGTEGDSKIVFKIDGSQNFEVKVNDTKLINALRFRFSAMLS